ncbi:MAG: hypothetical protein ABJH68_10840 [Ilumatobacter sp.]|uniref:hypothetical protein n=1 Tax=Ilumatobacter sp. TaxID=1967498 RepID=UPI003297EFD1
MWWVLVLVGVVVTVLVVVGLFTSLKSDRRSSLDPFTVGEPWRQFVQGATRSGTKLGQTIADAEPGPLRDRMTVIAGRLEDGLRETWGIARRGDQIDAAIARLEPTALRSKLATLETRSASGSTPDIESAIASVESQLESVRRLELESKKTADRLRLTQTRLDELVSRAAEVAIGAGDTDAYEHDVDDLVIELEALRQAVDETNRP